MFFNYIWVSLIQACTFNMMCLQSGTVDVFTLSKSLLIKTEERVSFQVHLCELDIFRIRNRRRHVTNSGNTNPSRLQIGHTENLHLEIYRSFKVKGKWRLSQDRVHSCRSFNTIVKSLKAESKNLLQNGRTLWIDLRTASLLQGGANVTPWSVSLWILGSCSAVWAWTCLALEARTSRWTHTPRWHPMQRTALHETRHFHKLNAKLFGFFLMCLES